MKKIILILYCITISMIVFAQAPEKMSYQAVIRNTENYLITNQYVGIKISILFGSVSGTFVYSEVHNKMTNDNGLVTLEIGNGLVKVGSFNSIQWEQGIYFLKTEIDPNGGTNYTITGVSQLLSVPYALHAKTADNVNISGNESAFANWDKNVSDDFSGDYNDLINKPESAGITGEESIFNNWDKDASDDFSGNYDDLVDKPTSFNDADADPTNEIQDISLSASNLAITNGSSVDLSILQDGFEANTDNQTLSVSGQNLTISNGNMVTLPTASSIWTKSSTNVYYNSGNVGIDESAPKSSLSVGGEGDSKARIYGVSTLKNGIGVYGKAEYEWGNLLQIPIPIHYGGFFESIGNFGVGVQGEGVTGVQGITEKNTGKAVVGVSKNTEGVNYGGYFTSESINGTGIYGEAKNTGNVENFGGYFKSQGESGVGVYGYASNNKDVLNYGGMFETDGTQGVGIYGHAKNIGDYRNYGGVFEAEGKYGVGIQSTGNLIGGKFVAETGSNVTFGLTAECSSIEGNAIYAEAKGFRAVAVKGIASSTGYWANYGGYFQANGGDGVGIYAKGNKYAGQFIGNVKISGDLNVDDINADIIKCTSLAGGFKLFEIDHPLKPETHNLSHACVETDKYMNIYNGNIILDRNGEAWVELPEWFEALNRDFTYQLTSIGDFSNIYIEQEVENNKFKISGGVEDLKVSWQVTGIRHDKQAVENPLQVVSEKIKQ